MKTTLLGLTGLVCCAAAWAGGVLTPQVGMVRYSDGALYPLFGLHANFLTGDRAFSLVQAASFSDQGGLISTRGRIMLLDANASVQGSYMAGEESPVLNMDGSAVGAIAWLPRSSELLTWPGGQPTTIAVGQGALGGQVDALWMVGTNAELLITENDGSTALVTVSLPGGNVTNVSAIPGVSGPVFEQQSFLLFHDSNGLEVQASNGSTRTLPITPADLQFEHIGTDWVHVSSPSAQRDWVLHLNATTLQISELPAPAQNSPLSKPMTPPAHSRTARTAE